MRFPPCLFLLLTSCGHAPIPPDCKALSKPKAVVDRCFGGKLDDASAYVGDLRCWPFSPPHRMRGIWIIDLETSKFFPNASTIKEATGQPLWLETDLLDKRSELLAAAQGAGRRVYAVELDGRESLCDGAFGHFGMTPRQVIAGNFHTIRLLSP